MLLALLAACACASGAAAHQLGGSAVPRVASAPPDHLIAYVSAGDSVALHARPRGRVVARLGDRTGFGSPRALGVVEIRNDRWLGVSVAGLGDHRLGWIDARAGGLRYARTRLEIDVELSARRLVVRRGGEILRKMLVGVGRSGSPTPTGRFSITDKLQGSSLGSYYGCCVLALSATQTHLPAGWTGGNRVAIHGTPTPSDFGHAVSAGCLHAREADLRYLMRVAALGTPVVIRR
jgi:L,D-transpeptidase catalytic domain